MNSQYRKLIVAVVVLLMATATVSGQSNDRIDELLAQSQARLDSTAYIILSAGGMIAESDGVDVAMEKLREMGSVGSVVDPAGLVSVQDLSFYLMKALALPGGVMYSLFPGPRYAYRELDFHKLVNNSGGPLRTVSGEEVMRTLGLALAFKKGGER